MRGLQPLRALKRVQTPQWGNMSFANRIINNITKDNHSKNKFADLDDKKNKRVVQISTKKLRDLHSGIHDKDLQKMYGFIPTDYTLQSGDSTKRRTAEEKEQIRDAIHEARQHIQNKDSKVPMIEVRGYQLKQKYWDDPEMYDGRVRNSKNYDVADIDPAAIILAQQELKRRHTPIVVTRGVQRSRFPVKRRGTYYEK